MACALQSLFNSKWSVPFWDRDLHLGIWRMHSLHIAYLFAVATGIVSSGAIASFWAILAGESPSFKMLGDDDILIPIKVPVVILSGPTTLIMDAAWWLFERPLLGILMLVGGLGWSFVQGVVILTKVFGVT